jgi:hypothetical protein
LPGRNRIDIKKEKSFLKKKRLRNLQAKNPEKTVALKQSILINKMRILFDLLRKKGYFGYRYISNLILKMRIQEKW